MVTASAAVVLVVSTVVYPSRGVVTTSSVVSNVLSTVDSASSCVVGAVVVSIVVSRSLMVVELVM